VKPVGLVRSRQPLLSPLPQCGMVDGERTLMERVGRDDPFER